MSTALKVYACELTSNEDVQNNLKNILAFLDQADSHSLVCFPENCLYMRVKEGEKIHPLTLEHPAFKSIAEKAKQKNLYVHLGSVPLDIKGKTYNSSVFIEPSGNAHGSYQKMHLFDIALEGQKPIRESDVFAHGAKPNLLKVGNWKIGETICYDIRFAELYHQYAKEGAHIILVPAAFLVKTGEAHWHVLLRARAIESQAYVVAAAQGGLHKGMNGGERSTYGHSVIIDPWGKIIAESTESQRMIHAELKLDLVQQVRTQIPMHQHRRL